MCIQGNGCDFVQGIGFCRPMKTGRHQFSCDGDWPSSELAAEQVQLVDQQGRLRRVKMRQADVRKLTHNAPLATKERQEDGGSCRRVFAGWLACCAM